MSDLDTLQPEVREAMEVIAGEAVCTCHVAYTSRGMKDPGCNHDLAEYVATVRAELLRLADVESELAALKARIAEAVKRRKRGLGSSGR